MAKGRVLAVRMCMTVADQRMTVENAAVNRTTLWWSERWILYRDDEKMRC